MVADILAHVVIGIVVSTVWFVLCLLIQDDDWEAAKFMAVSLPVIGAALLGIFLAFNWALCRVAT